LGDELEIPLPPWGDFVEWNGRSLPLGKGRHGLITAQAASPHILISGKTGSGKTIYMLRTLVTASLAMGEQVVNFGYSDSGFGIFETHANYHSLQLEKASDIIPCLKAVYGELQSRKGILGGSSMDWEHWQNGNPPRPFVRIVMDELGNMAEDIYMTDDDGRNTVRDLWRWVKMIANEGRKVGIRFVAALQDPTAKSMDLRFRRNCTLVAFQQGDASQSSAFIGTAGAEQLPMGRFMARMEQMAVGGGFAPTDAEINEYLLRHGTPRLETPRWIAAVDSPRIEEVDIPATTPTILTAADEIAKLAEGIRDQWEEGMSGSAVARLLGLSQYGGSYKSRVDKVIAYLTSTLYSTTPKMPEIGVFGAVEG
jgi:hypothetical protein